MSQNNGHHGERAIDEILSIPVPKGWARTKVADVGEVRLGRQRSPKNRSSKYPTKYLRAANLTWDGIDLGDVLDMDFRPEERAIYRLQPGDVLLSEASGSATEVGKPAIWNGELEDCCFQNTVIRFRSNAVDSRFALVAFQHFARNNIFARVAKGVGIHHLSADRFASMPFLLPPKSEQRRIVEKIEELFSDLDAGVAALERAKASLKRYRAAVLKAAVTGNLTAQWRVEHPDVEPASQLLDRILADRRHKWEADQLAKFVAANKSPPKNWRAKYTEPAPPDTTNLPPLPTGWCWATIEQLASFDPRSIQSGPFGSNLLHSEFQSEGILAIGIDNVLDGRFSLGSEHRISNAKFKELEKYEARPFDILITVMATVGRCCVVPANIETSIITKHVYRISPNRAFVNPWFVQLAISGGPVVRRQIYGEVRGQTRPGINGEILKAVAVPVPPLAEQDEIVAAVAEKLSQIEAADAAIDHCLARAARLRQSILKRAFAGQLVPQDPDDEPASTLLGRIQANGNLPLNPSNSIDRRKRSGGTKA